MSLRHQLARILKASRGQDTRARLADDMGVTVAALSQIERGINNPTLDRVELLAHQYGAHVAIIDLVDLERLRASMLLEGAAVGSTHALGRAEGAVLALDTIAAHAVNVDDLEPRWAEVAANTIATARSPLAT